MTDRIEALAEAWASIDGKLDKFRACKADPDLDMNKDGYFSGYMEEAEEMIRCLERRGFTVTPL
jgi:hypothetical protein